MALNIYEIPKVIITLPSRTNRLNRLAHELRLIELFDKFILSEGIIDQKPSRGIAMAHIKAIKTGLEFSDNVLVMEDDVFFPGRKKTMEYIVKCFENLPSNWELLLGGVYYHNRMTNVNEYWSSIDIFSGMHFYVINKKAFQKIEQFNCSDHIDRAISSIGLNCFVSNKFFAMQTDGFSDNLMQQTNHNQGAFKKYKILESK